jgi:arylsulfatase A
MYFELGYARAIRKGDFKYLAVRYPEKLEAMSPAERKAVLDDWNAERKRKHLRIVTEDPTELFSHLTAIPGGGDAERASTGSYPGYYDRDQLYDLSKDPNEQKNLAANPEYADKLAEMKAELEKMVESLPGTFGEFGKQSAAKGNVQ